MLLKNQTGINEKEAEIPPVSHQEFLATISHEIRSPLNAIIGLSKLLKSNKCEVERENYIDSLLETSENLVDLIDNILDFSKLKSDGLVLSLKPTKLKDLIYRNFMVQKTLSESDDLKLVIIIDEKLPDLLVLDQVLLRQVISNLTSNAVKFTSNGTISLEVNLLEQTDSHAIVKFSVRDTGIGISKDQLTSIFEPFNQGSDDINLRYGGAGLGLSICKKIINVMGGDFHVESEIGKGSTFSFSLELEISNDLQISSSMADLIKNKIPPNPLRILIVDDNKIDILVVRKYLEQWGFDYRITSNGKEALELVQEQNFDFVLMDLHMPVLDGLEATREIRSLPEPKFKKIPIIGLTASTEKYYEDKVNNTGFTDILSKPFRPEDLWEKFFPDENNGFNQEH